jgi:hypothetical protein
MKVLTAAIFEQGWTVVEAQYYRRLGVQDTGEQESPRTCYRRRYGCVRPTDLGLGRN